jgi:diadenosine tetraphosphate (Ap4A) HIT family hydrolase
MHRSTVGGEEIVYYFHLHLIPDSLGSYSASPPFWKGSPRQPGDVGEAA